MMEIDWGYGVVATGAAAGPVGEGAVGEGQSSAVPGDSRPNKRQRREEEGGAGEAFCMGLLIRGCMCCVAV